MFEVDKFSIISCDLPKYKAVFLIRFKNIVIFLK